MLTRITIPKLLFMQSAVAKNSLCRPGLLAIGLTLWWAGICPASDPRDYEVSFHDSNFDNTFLAPTSQGNASLARPEKDGIHLKSAQGQLANNLGFGPKFKIHGDFEVTATFTVVEATQPTDGFGTGAVMQLNTVGPDPSTAIFGRLCRKDGKEVISTYTATGSGNQRKSAARMFPTTARNLQFKIARKGQALTFSVAEPPSEEFRTLSTLPFGSQDVTLLRCGLQQSHAEANVEVVWHDLHVHAAELLDRPDALPAGEKQHRPQLQYTTVAPFPWGWASATVILAVLLVTVWWRQRALHS